MKNKPKPQPKVVCTNVNSTKQLINLINADRIKAGLKPIKK